MSSELVNTITTHPHAAGVFL